MVTAIFSGKLRSLWFSAVMLLAIGLLAACGGGGDAGTTGVRSFGEIETLGSIVVNGVKYEVEKATIVGIDNLREGMVVEVEGEVHDNGKTGDATVVRFDDNVTGVLTGLPRDDDGLKIARIMGQTVIFEDNLTKFAPGTGLPLGDDVNKVFVVSGFVRDDGKIQATFAGKLSDDFDNFLVDGGVLEVTGIVTGLTATTFMINDLTVDFSNATLRNLPLTGLAEGMLVKAKGDAFVPATTTLTATEVEGKTKGLGDDIGQIKAEGIIAELNTGARTFALNGQLVDYSKAAFRAGDEIDLANGIKVEAEGALTSGILVATRITFKASVRLEADVATIDPAASTLTFAGLPGISVKVDEDFTSGAAAFASLTEGNQVKIRARQAASGLIATRLEKVSDNPGGESLIRGPVTAISDPELTILGTVVVDTASAELKDHDAPITRQQFFARLQTGDIVKARFRNSIWDRVEIED